MPKCSCIICLQNLTILFQIKVNLKQISKKEFVIHNIQSFKNILVFGTSTFHTNYFTDNFPQIIDNIRDKKEMSLTYSNYIIYTTFIHAMLLKHYIQGNLKCLTCIPFLFKGNIFYKVSDFVF